DHVYSPRGIGPTPKVTWTHPGHVVINSDQANVFAAAAFSALLLWLLMRRTSLGLRLRALVDRPDLARMRGVDPGRSSAVAWMLGTMLAGLAGVVGAPVFNSLLPDTYTFVLFVAAAAAVFGAFRSIPLAFVGGLVLGVAQNLVAGYATFASGIVGFNSAVPFVILLVGLIVVARDRSRTAGTTVDDVPVNDYFSDLPRWRRTAPWVVAVAFLFVYLFWLGSDFWVSQVTRGLILGLIFLSFVIVTGLGGLVSLAQAAFVTIAGLTAGLLINRFDLPFWPALLGGVVVSVILGIIIALPSLRVGGLAFALSTLALALLADRVLFPWNWFRNNQVGWTIPRPSIGPLHFDTDRSMAVLALVLIGGVILLIRNLERSASGRAIVAVRVSEPAATASGISVVGAKLRLFVLAAVVAGVGGVLLGSYTGSVNSEATPALTGLLWLATVVLFGIRRPAAAVVAGLMSAVFPAILAYGVHWPSLFPDWMNWNGTASFWVPSILFGLGAIQLSRNPDGALSVTARQNHERRARKAQKRGTLVPAESKIEDVRAAERREIDLELTEHAAQLVEEGIVRVGAAVPTSRTSSTGATALSLERVDAGYGDLQVLSSIDLALQSGTITALLGPNGAGKSTLCAVAAGLIRPTRGRVVLLGDDVSGVAVHLRARRGLLATPEQRGVFPALTVDENLALRLRRTEREEVYERFPMLRDRRSIPASDLSGGEQQILSLGPFAVRPPRVLIADEPTLGLAPLVVRNLMAIFDELRRDGVAILLVEEKSQVVEVADYVAFLELGHIVWAGPKADVDDHQLVESYLGRFEDARPRKADREAATPRPAVAGKQAREEGTDR
ncbi:MAG: ABC-type branched-chain amino acid transport system ATPase component-like protein, partial [Actinomycetia bacterium]|nr:ABC-type branched-chain amino acid transport system ATPase component-like protein [Actinomycetes bacterium]